ncbi:MAG TPA: right-handed parallel beta-helix repeat-containing protein [Thermoanaerobaculia bacterium]
MARTLALAVLFLIVSVSAQAAGPFIVTNTNDSGPGSLREALANVDAIQKCSCRVEFRIDEPVPESGYFTIKLDRLLPIVHLTENFTLDGTTQTAHTGDTNPTGPEIFIDGENVTQLGPGLRIVDCAFCDISSIGVRKFQGNGIHFDRGHGINLVGLDLRDNGWNGLLYLRAFNMTLRNSRFRNNGQNGIFTRAGTVNAENLIVEGNGANGIDMGGWLTSFNAEITGNAHHGVRIAEGSQYFSSLDRIWANGLMPIERGAPGPSSERFDIGTPAVSVAQGTQGTRSARVNIRGLVSAGPNAEVDVTIFASPVAHPLGFGEARNVLTAVKVRTDSSGMATFNTDVANVVGPLPPLGFITATARTIQYGSSEFSLPVPLETNAIVVSSTADSGPGSLRAAIEAANARTCTADDACWIASTLPDGAVIEPLSPLPALVKNELRIDANPAVEILGRSAGNTDGLRIDTASAVLNGLVMRGFGRSGLVVNAPSSGAISINIDRSRFLENQDGLTLRGGRLRETLLGDFTLGTTVERVEASNNRGNGIVIEGNTTVIAASRVEENDGNGIFVRSGRMHTFRDVVARRNAGAGIATLPGAYGIHAGFVSTADNGGLGIDRDADGVTANDETEADKILDKPRIISSRYDAARQATIVTFTLWNGVGPDIVEPLEIFSHRMSNTYFYVNDSADPSGFGEGAQRINPGTSSVTGETVLAGDLRGKWITAVRTVADCHFELGCVERDTSEHSNAVRVE